MQGYTRSEFFELLSRNPIYVLDEVQRWGVEKPLDYLFEVGEISKLSYQAVAAWQYLHAIVGDYTCDCPYYGNPDNIVIISECMNAIGEVEQYDLLCTQAESLKEFTADEIKSYLRFDGTCSQEAITKINKIFYGSEDWYRKRKNIVENTSRKIAYYLLENEEIEYVEKGKWHQAIAPEIDVIPNYWERLKVQALKYDSLVYPLILKAKERMYQQPDYYSRKKLGSKVLIIGELSTCKGDRLAVTFSDGHQLVDRNSNEVIVQEYFKNVRESEMRWSIKDAPKWRLNEGVEDLVLIE